MLKLPEICNGGGRTSVLAHSPYNEDGGGKGMKADDHLACIACSDCHDILDRRRPSEFSELELRDYFHVAMKKTIKLWIEEGLLK